MGVSKTRRGCLQFSLRTILALMTLSALLCGVLFAAPIAVGLTLLFFEYTAIPVGLTVMIVYGRNYLRTFAIGAMFPGALAVFYSYAVLLSSLGDLGDNSMETRMIVAAYLVGLCVVLVLYGGTAVLIRWLVERWQAENAEPEPEDPVPESPFDAEMPVA